MKLATIRLDGGHRAVRVDDDVATVLDAPDVGALLADPGWRASAAAATGAVCTYAVEGLLLGDPRITAAAFWPSLAGTTTYSVLLTPLVVPVVGALVRRLEDDPVRR